MKKFYFLLLFLATYSVSAQLVINEYMPYPSSTSITDSNELDSNKDGSLSGLSDEYIELVNSGASDLDISGWKINDGADRHVFPSGTTVPAGGAIIIFGGGTGLSSADFGNSIVQESSESSSLGLSNSGDTFEILNASDVSQLSETYASADPGIAFTRSPDVTGSIVTHPANASLLADGGSSAFASPGTKIDGSLFIVPTSTEVQFSSASSSVDESSGTFDISISITSESSTNATTVDVVLTTGSSSDINSYTTQTVTFPAGSSVSQVVTLTITDDSDIEGDEDLIFTLQNLAGGDTAVLGTNTTSTLTIVDNDFTPTDLVVNEFMPWPAGSTSTDTEFDSNGDGAYGGLSDEYIEFVNMGTSPLDISGWKINDGIDRHIFPASTVIPAGGVVLVFGGGTPNTTLGYFGGAIVQVASESTSLGLLNSGDAITIKDDTDATRLTFSYGAATRAIAFTRNPDITGTSFVEHPINTSGLKNEDLTDAKASPGFTIDGATLSNESFESMGVTMYPNPVSDGLVHIKFETLGDKSIELYDVNGRSILQTKLKSDVLDVSAITSGFYLLKVSVDGRSATSKLLIK